jgi:hypothetical protein
VNFTTSRLSVATVNLDLSPSYARLGRAASAVATKTFGGEAENLGEVENAWRRLAWKVGIHRTGLSKIDDERLVFKDRRGRWNDLAGHAA